MKFETLKKSHLKRNILIGLFVVAVISAIILNFTRAKYRVTQSIPLVNGTINYSKADLNLVAMYQANESGEYISIDKVPDSGYDLNEEKSYCEVNGEKDNNIQIEYSSGSINFLKMTTKGTKCYLYFDENSIPVKEQIIKNYSTLLKRNDFNVLVTNITTGTIYYEDTSKGRTYYFAGNPTDNWVKFAGFYWRIIRVNEDGTIRMIYQGTSANITGAATQIGTSVFNYTYGDNTYVGYMMGLNNQCNSGNCEGTNKTTSYAQATANSYDSTIKQVLDTWFENNLLNVSNKIDGNAGFCGDRTISSGDGYGSNQTNYAVVSRVTRNRQPTFECSNSNDLYTTKSSDQGNKSLKYPIGLITADEAVYAGRIWPQDNANDYLQTGQLYWTMSPSSATYASVLHIGVIGIGGENSVYHTWGVRPVINLKADVTISSGDGTASNPYVIAT